MDLRRIDALVAERVMGWTLKEGMWAGGSGYEEWRWRPTTDGNDMLRVVERMAEKEYSLKARFIRLTPHDIRAWVAFRSEDEYQLSNTLPLAVCLAALRVVLTAEEFAEVTK